MGRDVGSQLTADEARAVLEQLPLAVLVQDAGAVVRYLNPAAEQVFGLTQDAVGRDGMALGVAPSDTETALEIMESLLAGRTWCGRFPITRLDGSRFVGTFLATAFRDGDGVPVGYLAVCTDPAPGFDPGTADDVESLRNAELLAQAEEANRLLESVLTSAPVGLAVFDRVLRYVRVNQALAAINGIPAEQHIGRRLTDLLTGLPPDVPRDIATVFDSGVPIVGREVVGETPARPGELRSWQVSYYPVRLRGEVRWVGVIATDTTEQRQAEGERARLLAAERRARADAEDAARRLAHLQAVTAGLAEARSPEHVATVVVEVGTLGIEATSGALCLVNDDGEHLDALRELGYHPATGEHLGRLRLDADLPVCDAVRTGELVTLRSVDERDTRYPGLAGTPTRNRALAVVPLTVRERRLGAVAVGWSEPREFPEGDLQFLLALGQQAAQALERVESLAAEQLGARRQAFLAEASRVLASSLDHHATLLALARLAVPEVADACVVQLVDEVPSQAAAAAVDPHGAAALRQVATSGPAREQLARWLDDDPHPLLLVDRDGGDAPAGPLTHQLAALRAAGAGPVLVVPIQSRGRGVGVLLLAMAQSGRRYRPADLAFASDIANRAGVAIDNARSHRARTEVAHTLQRSLLPPKAPLVPGVEVAARYRPVGDGSEMGGDFYDAFPIRDDRWGLVIGDVSGKGVLAASVTALARYTVRAEARREASPAAVLRSLNRHLLEHDTGERFCTITHAFVDPLADPVRLALSVGGHPLPVRLGADTTVSTMGRPGTAVGLFSDLCLHDDVYELAPGDTLVLFTDGIVEARAADGRFFADELFHATLRAAAGGSADDIADAVEQAALSFQGGQPRDDLALLVLRVPRRRFRHRLVPAANAVAGARGALRRWLVEDAALDPRFFERVPVVASELLSNAVRAAREAVEIRAWADAGELVVDVSDDGSGFDGDLPDPAARPNPGADRGRGLYMVREMTDDCVLQSSPSGTFVRCCIKLPPARGGRGGYRAGTGPTPSRP